MFWNRKPTPAAILPTGIGAADFAGAGTPLKFNSVEFRDGQQSLFATRMTTEDMVPLLTRMDQVGYDSIAVSYTHLPACIVDANHSNSGGCGELP